MALRILHHGWFLREGLTELGCEVLPFKPRADATLDEQVEATGFAPDVVLLELFGKAALPRGLHASRHRLAAYCVDSPLNGFWLVPLLRCFDLAWVDQLASVARFGQQGASVRWLPLCVSRNHFRAPAAEPEHFLTFVGRTSETRAKRANLLKHISARFPLNLVQNVTTEGMLDLFANSRVVLNENFFPGLNLRFFHGLASGGLLLSERGGQGVDRLFEDGAHFVSFDHTDVLDVLGTIQKAPKKHAAIAAAGQALCLERHTSAARAKEILADLRALAERPRRREADAAQAEALAMYRFAQRFGGDVSACVRTWKQAAQDPQADPSQALGLLGAAAWRSGKVANGLELLEAAASLPSLHGLDAALKLLVAQRETPQVAARLARVMELLAGLGLNEPRFAKRAARMAKGQDVAFHCCMLCCDVLWALDRAVEPGFSKPAPERLPDTALEAALLAFAHAKAREALDAIVRCAKQADMAAEALPHLTAAILEGAASDRQIALAASLAQEYYDFDYARTVLQSLKRRRTAR